MTPGDTDRTRELFVRHLSEYRPADGNEANKESDAHQRKDRPEHAESFGPNLLSRIGTLRNRLRKVPIRLSRFGPKLSACSGRSFRWWASLSLFASLPSAGRYSLR